MMKKKKGLYVIPVLFLVILLLPLIFVNRQKNAISVSENRTLASPAEFYTETGEINQNYLQDILTWFNDNLGFREQLVQADGAIHYYIFNEIKDMPLGSNGELAPYANLNDYQHKNLFTEKELNTALDKYKTINDYLESQDIQVYYFQCWDKHSIYPEQYTQPIRIFGNVSLTDQFEQGLIENDIMNVISIKQTLVDLKPQYTTYGTWSDPWHWNQRGGFIAYRKIIDEINKNNNEKYIELTEDDFNITVEDKGQTFFGIIHREDYEEVFTLKNPKALNDTELLTYFPKDGLPQHGSYYINNSVYNNDTLLIIGDSYFHDYGVLTSIAESFHTTVMLNGDVAHDGQLMKIIETYDPDIVIFENTERAYLRLDQAISTADNIKGRILNIGDKIIFNTDNNNSSLYTIDGFSEPEKDFTWTDGDKASMLLYLDNIDKATELHAVFELNGVFNGKQNVTVLVNNRKVFSGEVVNGDNIAFDFTVSDAKTETISLLLPDSCSPFSTGESTDERDLALMIRSFYICEK